MRTIKEVAQHYARLFVAGKIDRATWERISEELADFAVQANENTPGWPPALSALREN